MPLAALFEQPTGQTGGQIQSILRAVRSHLGMDVGFVSEFVAGDRVVRYLDGDMTRGPLVVGSAEPLEQSFCYYVAHGLIPGLVRDAADDPVAARLAATRTVPVGAHLSVPLRHADGVPFGTLCCFSFGPDRGLTSRDLGLLQLCAEVVSAAIENERVADRDHDARCRGIQSLIEREALDLVFQPVYRTLDGQLMAFEALSRFDTEPRRPPDAWFADAASVGLGEELEILALRKAVAALDAIDPAIKLMVNLSPTYVTSAHLMTALSRAPLGRVILELTENVAVEDYAPLREALAPLRARGLRLAIDDVGAGHSSLRHVLDLAPEFIKLDRSLTHAVDLDSSRRALATALTSYSRQIGCEVVAEGVETEADYRCLRDIGVTRVQGFFLGRPMPLGDTAGVPKAFALDSPHAA